MNLLIDDYTYDLPQDRISQFPLTERDQSKLLLYKGGEISQDVFRNVAGHLPDDGLLVVNNTRVIHARLIFVKPTGARVEVFCLHPVEPAREIQSAFGQHSGVVWECLIGNAKRWKTGTLSGSVDTDEGKVTLTAGRLQPSDNPSRIRFTWMPGHLTFSQVLDTFGKVPLPPYVHREPVPEDMIRYQTIYASMEGSVAAPTAGLHFTPHILDELKKKNTRITEVTLHIGAGTFTPVTTPRVDHHTMHTEVIHLSRDFIRTLRQQDYSHVIAVGTTTVRTLESLYWFGDRLYRDPKGANELYISQWQPYQDAVAAPGLSVKDALTAVLDFMDKKNLNVLYGRTQLMIVPGYRYRIPDILITNFHQPRSTLLLLVAAFIGDDWRKAYAYALEHDFRFLSYGDSCLFYRNDSRQ